MLPVLIYVGLLIALMATPILVCAYACDDCQQKRKEMRERIRLEAREWLTKPRYLVFRENKEQRRK